jgi:hypothetical protein
MPDPAIEASIPVPLADGAAQPAKPPAALPEFVIKSETTRELDVVKPPPMDGLPPITGTITETVQVVEDPGLPEPGIKGQLQVSSDPAALARLESLRAARKAVQLVCVSATVYNHSRTLLVCNPGGEPERKITVWSNLDFSHFSGFGKYQVKGKDGVSKNFELMMLPSVVDTARMEALMRRHGRIYSPPAIPDLPDLSDGGPAYVVAGGDETDLGLIEIIDGLHALYRSEGGRMEAAYEARIQAREEQKAALLADPPQPPDVTVRVWKRDAPTTESAKGGEP